AITDAGGIQAAAHGVIAHTRQVFHPTTADQHDAVFLQVVAFTTDVGAHLITVGKTHTADLAQRRVRLLGRSGIHTGTYAALLRVALQRRYVALLYLALAGLAHQLVDGCHSVSPVPH